MKLDRLAKKNKFNFVIDASNISDKKDYRPGAKAKKESGVRSPLQEAGFSKGDIRVLSRKLDLPTWDKPALACLASRVPYGAMIDASLLFKIDRAENFLRSKGFRQVRLRHYGETCRIEVMKKDMPRLIGQAGIIAKKMKKLGYRYITVDLEGYRTGSMNEVFK